MSTPNDDTIVPSAASLINLISGLYTAPLWDRLRSLVDSLETLRKFARVVGALQDTGKTDVAFEFITALYEAVGYDVPKAITILGERADSMKLFVYEFIADTSDIIWD